MKKIGFALLLVLAVAFALPAYAAEYVGAAKGCKMCHKKDGSWDVWEKSKHAKAGEALKSEAAKAVAPDAEKNETCLKCHMVGKDEGVGCEACHGPGSEYKAMDVMKDPAKAKEKGCIKPDEAVCKKCHGAKPEKHPAGPEFKYEEAKEKIKHWK